MRIRQVKPEFWKDRVVADLSRDTRLTYIGLWMMADDAGWLRLDAPTVALELYGWDDRAVREEVVTVALAELEAAGRLMTYECHHALIPTLVNHQRFAGETKRVFTFRREHERCPRIPAGTSGEPDDTRGSPPIPDPVRNGRGQSGLVSVRSVSSDARKREVDDDAVSEFQRRVARPVIQ